ncbi:Ig-like domain-containing protein [Staphylococcus pseudintermedius]|nr:Ig-like domain-containing protein [Staphylococcus pseudintermedius]EGQ3835007.1 Ig-like domain-containing protein [Staphylococcus pseudintermedius]EHP6917390.1 Ig-like domain-containing protein [Staphylococcus pseudintermedius]EII2159321.1 Ig-like domain-containing protein [Staphylococcus pseudintermedius]EII2689123.1 Ig-like domain-containing protein [Staphylococcus pseudintermedius]
MEMKKYPFTQKKDFLKLNMQHFAQTAKRSGDDEIMFGLADILIGEGDDLIKFDGKNGDTRSYLQVEGGSVSFEPDFEDITFQDYGNGAYDQRVVSYGVTVKIVAGQETIDILKLAIAGTEDVTDESGDVTGVTDSPLGASNRRRGKPIRIHPRFAGNDHSRDINIYKAASNSEAERAFGNEQGTFEMEFIAYVRDGADANKKGNYFFTGETDPNGVLPTWDEVLNGQLSKEVSTRLEDVQNSSKPNVTSINLTADKESIKPFESTRITATVQPDTANKALKYSGNNDSVATVNADTGEVTGVSEGVVNITATAQDTGRVTGTIQITVENEV